MWKGRLAIVGGLRGRRNRVEGGGLVGMGLGCRRMSVRARGAG